MGFFPACSCSLLFVIELSYTKGNTNDGMLLTSWCVIIPSCVFWLPSHWWRYSCTWLLVFSLFCNSMHLFAWNFNYVDNSLNFRAFAGINRWQKWCTLFPTISGGHVLCLPNHRFSHPGFHPTGPRMSKTSAKPITWPMAVEQSTCINWFLPPAQPY